MKKLLCIVCILMVALSGCNNQNNNLDEANETIKILTEKVSELETENERLVYSAERLRRSNDELKEKIIEYLENDLLNEATYNLMNMSEENQEVYARFKEDYDKSTLIDKDPLTICKLYFHAISMKDYETEYQLYIQGENIRGWTYEEHMEIPDEHRMTDFEAFKKVYRLHVKYNESKTQATIIWELNNGEMDTIGELYKQGFSLMKDEDDIWRVGFVPMQ